MLQILPKITFGQNQITQKPSATATAPKLERTPKRDCVSFGNYNFLTAEDIFKKYATQAKKLRLSDDLMKPIINDHKLYELPVNFLFAMRNSPSRHYVEKIPAIIQDCGLPIDIALKKLDKMANILRISKGYIKIPKFKLGNKTISSMQVGSGNRGNVYRFKSNNESLAFKIFHMPTMLCSHGLFGETAIAREFTKAGTIDTAELYMASPHQHTGWMMTEFVTSSTKKNKEGPSYNDFLKEHDLLMGDNIATNYIKDSDQTPIRIDFGGVYGKDPMHLPSLIKNELFKEPNPQESFNDEGTVISAIQKHLFKTNNIDVNHVKEALETPEGRFAYEMYSTFTASEEKIESALRDIDVVKKFQID